MLPVVTAGLCPSQLPSTAAAAPATAAPPATAPLASPLLPVFDANLEQVAASCGCHAAELLGLVCMRYRMGTNM